MKKISFILLNLFLFTIAATAQLGGFSCSSYQTYDGLLNKNSNWKVNTDVYVKGYGQTEEEALINAKKKLMLKYFQETYLDNALTSEIIAEFAPEIIKTKEPYIHKSKGADRKLGKYTCEIDIEKHNDAAVKYIEKQLKNLIANPVVFIINPYIMAYGDDITKDLYKRSLMKWRTAMLDVKYRFNNILTTKMLQLANLPFYNSSYNPCTQGFKYFKTGNKYKDFATAALVNESTSKHVRIIFSLDSIMYYEPENKVTFHLVAFDAHTYQYLMEYELFYKATDVYSAADAVDQAINSEIFKNKVNEYMHQFIERYASYVRDGIKFSLKICNNVLNQNQQFILLNSINQCTVFEGVSQTDWRLKGAKIGSIYSGRIKVIDPTKQDLIIKTLLIHNHVSLDSAEINKMGMDYTITPKY